jgi:hypothetical protein
MLSGSEAPARTPRAAVPPEPDLSVEANVDHRAALLDSEYAAELPFLTAPKFETFRLL